MNEILSYANQSKAREKIIILDCCHSGAFGSSHTDGKSEISEGMVVLTAALPSQQAIEEKGHGIFTSLLAEALNGAASDLLGQVTPGAIYHYVDQALGSWEQRPIFKTNVTSWTPLRIVPPGPGSPAIPRETLRKIADYFPTTEEEYKLAPEYEFTMPQTMIRPKWRCLKICRHSPPLTWWFPSANTTCTGPPSIPNRAS